MHLKAYSLLGHVKRNLRSGNLQYVDQSQRLRTCGSRQLLGQRDAVNLNFPRFLPRKEQHSPLLQARLSMSKMFDRSLDIHDQK